MKLIAKNKSIRDYKRMSKDELISSNNESKPIKNKTITDMYVYMYVCR